MLTVVQNCVCVIKKENMVKFFEMRGLQEVELCVRSSACHQPCLSQSFMLLISCPFLSFPAF